MKPCPTMYIPRTNMLMSSCYYLNYIKHFSPQMLKSINTGIPIKKTSDEWYPLFSTYYNLVIKEPTGFMQNNGGDMSKFWYLQPITYAEFYTRMKNSSLVPAT